MTPVPLNMTKIANTTNSFLANNSTTTIQTTTTIEIIDSIFNNFAKLKFVVYILLILLCFDFIRLIFDFLKASVRPGIF